VKLQLTDVVTAMGLYPAAALSMMWLQDNVSGFYKRSSMVGIALTLANTAGVVVGQIFTTDTQPLYIKGLSICLGFAVFAFLIVLSLSTGMHLVNKKRQRVLREADGAGHPIVRNPALGDYDPHFKYML
jgi:hypothetical protein